MSDRQATKHTPTTIANYTRPSQDLKPKFPEKVGSKSLCQLIDSIAFSLAPSASPTGVQQ